MGNLRNIVNEIRYYASNLNSDFINNLLSKIELEVILLSLGVSITFVAVVWLLYSWVHSKKDRWKVDTRMDVVIVRQKDSIDKFISSMEKQIQNNKVNLKAKHLFIVVAILCFGAFTISFLHFKNLVASVLIALIIFAIPDYIFFLLEERKNKKIEDLIVVAIRVFTSEFLKNKNIEKSFHETSQRVLDPVGNYFAEAYTDMLIGHPFETVMSRMAVKCNNKYWGIFIQLLYQLRDDSVVINLFTELVTRVERSIEATRHSDSTLAGERTLALITSLVPIPAYLFMRKIVPETTYFITETTVGKLVLISSFISTLLFLYVDKFSRRVN